MNKLFFLSVFIFITVLIFFSVWCSSDADSFRSNVPCGVEIERSVYATSDYMGVGGPGDFYAVFAAFELSENSVKQIKNGGAFFLGGLKCGPETGSQSRRKYFSWKKTPSDLTSLSQDRKFQLIREYLDSRGLKIIVPKYIMEDAQYTVAHSGNFIGQNEYGFVVINIEKSALYYIYSN
ncbi:hypothetical protein [Rhizobium rhizogenes]|uniref:hypothetical protein n=1 Tax=Rhizobium rhizogenes TaxID=359 RepID=UPI0022BD7BE2|nr:hypothetical protein [Rhizobium rhizogenes]MCZ7488134.1 hypothetical protein [Rhizobium rhizogenes]